VYMAAIGFFNKSVVAAIDTKEELNKKIKNK
jgi:hypothetical protein